MLLTIKKPGWKLNPDYNIRTAIIKRIEACNGECPCDNPGETLEDRLCPCKEYREHDICHCTLYVKDTE